MLRALTPARLSTARASAAEAGSAYSPARKVPSSLACFIRSGEGCRNRAYCTLALVVMPTLSK